MTDASGLRRKIWVAFILQMIAISFAAVLGVYAVATVIEDALVHFGKLESPTRTGGG